jgi:hypothetical protein
MSFLFTVGPWFCQSQLKKNLPRTPNAYLPTAQTYYYYYYYYYAPYESNEKSIYINSCSFRKPIAITTNSKGKVVPVLN